MRSVGFDTLTDFFDSGYSGDASARCNFDDCFRPEADLFPRPRAFGASQTSTAVSPACGELEMCDAAM